MEKLTAVVSVKVSADMHQQVQALAQMGGFDGPSDFIRNLICKALESERKRFELLTSVFGQQDK